MTPNHVQPLFYVKSGQVKEKYIKDVNFNENNKLIVSGKGNGTKQTLTYMDRLAIACQADGTIQSHNKNYNHWSIKLKKQRKIDRLLQILNEGDIEYSEIKAQEGCRRFVFNTPVNVTKNLNTYFNLDFNYNGARAFIEEISVWDGYITNDYIEYMSIDKSNVDFISAVAVLGGYNARQRSQVDNRQDNYNTIHKVFLYDMEHMDCQAIRKTVTTKEYKGNVYCVKVPSHQIVIRSQGFVFITGNCHTLSQQAWSSMLITLEENIPHSIFILCTTDIQKIPNTIISRVTRFNFMPMTENSIIDRLKYVCSQENITITDKGIEYIAKSANGNMRQALTNLDKCLLYGLSEAEICKALNIVSEDVMSELYASYGTDRQKTIKLIEDIYNNGYELHLFIRQFLDYCVKKDNLKLVETLLTINNEIRYDDTPKNIIIARLII
jgi:DNA polymerase III delta prime subunit